MKKLVTAIVLLLLATSAYAAVCDCTTEDMPDAYEARLGIPDVKATYEVCSGDPGCEKQMLHVVIPGAMGFDVVLTDYQAVMEFNAEGNWEADAGPSYVCPLPSEQPQVWRDGLMWADSETLMGRRNGAWPCNGSFCDSASFSACPGGDAVRMSYNQRTLFGNFTICSYSCCTTTPEAPNDSGCFAAGGVIFFGTEFCWGDGTTGGPGFDGVGLAPQCCGTGVDEDGKACGEWHPYCEEG